MNAESLKLVAELNPRRGVSLFSIAKEIKDTLVISYKNPITKQGAENLVTKLTDINSDLFKSLK